MTGDDAREQVRQLVGDAAMPRLEHLVDLVLAENEQQNLIARSTIPAIWSRHVLDSVQLLQWQRGEAERWLDIGTGGGFPGLAVAVVSNTPMLLAEPRRRRAEFLRDAAAALGLGHVRVEEKAVESLAEPQSVISARAVASIDVLLEKASTSASLDTRWLFLRGQHYQDDLDLAQKQWDAMFHVEQSLSDPHAKIVIADRVRRR